MPAIAPILDFIVSQDFLSKVNPFLLQTEIATAVLLGLGIVFESNRYPESVHSRVFWFVVIGVTLETIFSILLFVSEESISSLQNNTIIELTARLAPRRILPEQQKHIVSELSIYKGQKFAFSIVTAP
jgi:hypothetical protein